MSLTTSDLQAINTIVDEAVTRRIKPLEDKFQTMRSIIREELEPIDHKVNAVENDVKEIYKILVKNNVKVV